MFGEGEFSVSLFPGDRCLSESCLTDRGRGRGKGGRKERKQEGKEEEKEERGRKDRK